MQYNYLVADSGQDSNRANAYVWSQNYSDYISVPRTVGLLSATIPITYLSFRKNQLTLYMSVYGSVYPIVLQNGYYDSITEFLPMLQTATNTGLGNTDFTWSYSDVHQCLKLSSSGTTVFSIMGYTYQPFNNVCKRLGFINSLNYSSYEENSISVVYASGVLQLARTSGFYIVSSLVKNSNTANPYGSLNILDFVPIDHANLAYGDTVTVQNPSFNSSKPQKVKNMIEDACSQFQFQILDDEFKLIDDVERGGKTILMLQCDYD